MQIAQALAGLARELGIETVVIDPRGRFLTEERFPGVTLDDRWPDEAIAAYAPGPATAVVTLSHDTKIDDPALIAALAAPTPPMSARWDRAAAMPRGGSGWRRRALRETDLDRIDGARRARHRRDRPGRNRAVDRGGDGRSAFHDQG